MTDPRYKLIGQIREDKLFKENDIYDKMVVLPNYNIEDTTKYDWNLYTNSYYYWSYHCEKSKETNSKNWYTILQRISDVHANTNYILATSIFFAIGISIIMMYFHGYFTMAAFSKKDEINKPMRNLFIGFAYPIRILTCVFLIYFCYTNISSITDYQDTIVSITVADCAPEFTTQAYFAYEQPLQSVYRMSYSVIIMSLMCLMVIMFDLMIELSVRGILKSTYGRFYAEFAD
jgi:hypothetical protein